MIVLDTGATANVVPFSWPGRRNRILEQHGIPKVAKARFSFGDGRLREVRHAADVPVGIAGNRGMFTAFALEAEIPALLREGVMEALGGKSNFLRGSLNLPRQGAQKRLGVNRVGRYILSVVDFRKDPSRSASRCPEASASLFHLVQKCPDLSDRDLHLPYTPDGLYRFETPPTFAASKAVILGDAEACRLTDPKKNVMKLHVN